MGSKTAYIEPSLTKENGYCESFIARFELSKFWLWRVTAPNPHAQGAMTSRSGPPSSGSTVHVPRLETWGGKFIQGKFCWGF